MDFVSARRTMVDCQVRPNDVTDFRLVSAFLSIPREEFVPASKRGLAYSEQEILTSEGRALWAPRDFSKLLKALSPHESDIALIIGAGAGYEAAVFGLIIETVIGLEDQEEYVEATTERLSGLNIDRAIIVEGALDKGLADQAPFDIIYINGMVEEVPQAWFEQLAEGGRLGVVVQTEPGLGQARVYIRSGGHVSYRAIFEACPPVLPGFERKKTFSF